MEKEKPSHKILRENYAISKYLNIPYTEVRQINSSEREYMLETIKSSIERGDDPQKTLAANYEITKAKLYITSEGHGTDLASGDYKITNVVNEVEVDVIYDTFNFRSDVYSTTSLGINYNDHEKVYIKFDEKMDEISKGDIIYLEIFNRMYSITKSQTFKLFELNGKYNIVNLIQYTNA